MDTDRLLQLVDARLAIATKLREFAQLQLATIETGDLVALLRILGGKQQLVEQLGRLDDALRPFAAQDPATRHWPSPERRLHCEQQQLRCRATLEEILKIEQQAESLLMAQREATSQRITSLHHSGQAQQAYVGSPPTMSPLSLDLMSEG